MAGRKSDFTLPTLDDLFSTQELRDDAKLSKIRDIPLELIDDFPDHPFKVRDDEDKVMKQLGFREGNILEPSCGIGHFIGMLPEEMKESKIYGVELDTISAGIAQQLYQKSSIAAQGFEETNLPDSFFDAVVGNVPFGDFKVPDKRYDKHKFLIHDYFFAKSLDKLRPGGVMALITSKGTMDKENSAVRKYIAQRADLLGAIRLPNNTFKGNAGTEVVSDILILQKRDRIVDTVTFGSNKIVWWKGACGHEWQTSIKARSAGEQCPICSGARVLRGYNDFESKFPELAKEWSPKNEPLKPSMITAATHRKVIWQCKLGHEWTASVKSRTVNGTGCPYCSHNFVLPGFNDLASRFPEIAAEWSERNLPLTPDQVTAFKNIKVWWQCRLGHEWNTLISTRAGGSQCPYCSGIKLLKGFNDLQTKFPSLAIEWSDKNLPLTPDVVNEKSTKNVWWKCRTCGYEWKAVVKARVKGGMCPVCAERAVLQGHNDLGTTDPHLLSEWDYEKNSKWTPSNVSRNSMKVVWWKCGAGHSYRAKITDRTIEQKGCPQCEAEFQQALPQMLIMMYGAQNGITVKSNSDSELGMRLVAYLPELHCAVDIAGATVTEKREQSVKAHICQSIRLGYYLIKRTADASQMAAEIKTLFIRNHIYLHTDSEKDIQVLRERFLEWKNRNACKLNGKY